MRDTVGTTPDVVGAVSATPDTMPVLEARNISVKYPHFSLAVERFALYEGRTTVLLGPSGSGKSTLLTVMGYLEKPQSGEVLLRGKHVDEKEARKEITAVFQRPYLVRGTVGRNVEYGLRIRHMEKQERARKVEEVLELVGLSEFKDRSVADLSGGEMQRVSLARALALDPSVLLLDEPLSSLDEALKTQLSSEFSRILKQKHIAALYVTHDRREALAVADTIALIRGGTLVSHISAGEIWDDGTDEEMRRFFGLDEVIEGHVMARENGLLYIRANAMKIAIPCHGEEPESA